MGFFKQMKDMKNVVDQAPDMIRQAQGMQQQATEMQAAQQAAAQQAMAQQQAAMAAAQQSAVQRGLGNTTIMNSLQRGAAFDATRQNLALEDQLLANRISTDSSLSNAYQGVLQNRAQGLASQWNQNIANDNQLAQNRLGYIGGIQENMDGFNAVANLYSQGLQMQNQNEQAEIDRKFQRPNWNQQYAPNTVNLGVYRTPW